MTASISKEIIQSNHVGNMPDTFPMIPMMIPDSAFVKRKVFLAKDEGNDHRIYLSWIDDFYIRGTGYCDTKCLKSVSTMPLFEMSFKVTKSKCILWNDVQTVARSTPKVVVIILRLKISWPWSNQLWTSSFKLFFVERIILW